MQMNINALETAALDRIRELVQDIRPLSETALLVTIKPSDMEAILEIQEIVNEDLSHDFDVYDDDINTLV